MAKVIVMPKLGLTMTEGEITKWYKSEGESVQSGEALFEVATAKLTNDVEAPESGVLRKVLLPEGETTACLDPVGIIAGADEDISSLLTEDKQEKPKAETSEARTTEMKAENKSVEPSKTGRIKASPVAKRLAKEKNIDLAFVTGTGPNGRIVLDDVENYLKSLEDTPKVKTTPMAEKIASELNIDVTEIKKDERIRKEDVYSYAKEKQITGAMERQEIKTPMTQMRKVIAQRMTESWHTSPAVSYDLRVDVTRLKEIRKQLKEIQRVTFTDLLVKIVARTLLEFPYLNSTIENDGIITRNYVNIGVAVALEDGLVVPVVKNADTKGLKQISTEVKELAEKAKQNALSPDDYSGGTFTITNPGMYGIESFSPIINQPEVAILGVNTILDTPVVEDGKVVIKPLMNLSLTADHRAVDGAVAAQFLARLKQYIEKPEILFL